MKKRATPLLLIVIMICSVLCTTVSAVEPAADTAVITGGSVSTPLAAGGTFDVPVTLVQNPGLAIAYVDITWDAAAFELTAVSNGGIMPDNGSQPLSQRTNSGKYTVAVGDFLATENYQNTGVLCTLTFTILDGAASSLTRSVTGSSYQIGLAVRDLYTADMTKVDASSTNAVITLTEAVKHAQQIPEGTTPKDNLWTVLTPENGYFKSSGWSEKYSSITFPVKEGDQIYSSSFQKKPDNGNTISSRNGIAVAYLDSNEEIIRIMEPDETYAEYSTYGYITIPADVSYVSVPMWTNNIDSVVNLLTLPEPKNSHLQWVAEGAEVYSDTNLWPLLEPRKEYHTGTAWRYDHATVYSVTIPVKSGDQIWANSFQARPANEGTSSGIAVTYFYGDEIVLGLGSGEGANSTYAEVKANGYLTVPEGVNAVCIPVWKNNSNAEVKLLTLPESPKVAKIEGGAAYGTLKAAVDAAQDGDTVIVTGTATVSEMITIDGKKITIDLNQQTVTATGNVFLLRNGAGLTMTDGTINATGEGVVVWSDGNGEDVNTIVVDGVTMTAEDYVIHHCGNYYGSDVTIKNSELTSSDGVAVYLSGLSTVGKWPEGKSNKLMIEDSAITGVTAVEGKRTEVAIKAGTVLTATGTPSITANPGGPCSTGYALALTRSNGDTVSSATITGGTFNGKIGIEENEDSSVTGTFAISGGSFSEIVPVEYCAEGFIPVTEQDSDGKYTVEEEPRNSHLQWVAEDTELYSDTNLWTLLTPKKEYHNGTVWKYTHKTVYSVTIPVKPGDQIYATSFQKYPANGNTTSTSNGIAVTFFYGDEVVKSLGTTGENSTYTEFTANGYITVPEGANAVCVPMWTNDQNAVLNLLTLPERPGYALSGTVTSSGDKAGEVALELWNGETLVDTVFTTDGNYSMDCVANGSYTLKASKTGHVTREYAVTVAGAAVTQDVKICLKGDVNGDGKTAIGDVGALFDFILGRYTLDEYGKACGNVNGDNKTAIGDVGYLFDFILGRIETL